MRFEKTWIKLEQPSENLTQTYKFEKTQNDWKRLREECKKTRKILRRIEMPCKDLLKTYEKQRCCEKF